MTYLHGGQHPPRRAVIAAWLGLPPTAVEGLSDEIVDAIERRMTGDEPHGTVLQTELVEHLRGSVERHRAAAETDQLTGLVNRRGLEERLATQFALSRRIGQPLAVLLADVNGLKAINDLHGHAAGDVVLRHVAVQLQATVRHDDMVARLAGDEFVAVCPGVDAAAVPRVAAKLARAARSPVRIDDRELAVSLSVGWAVSTHAASPEQLLRAADEAMYRSKVRTR